MKKQVKIGAAALCAVVLLAAALYTALRPVPVEAVRMRPQAVSLTFTEAGSYEYGRTYAVYPLVAGELLELPAKEGDRVRAGDVIAVVSASDYEHQIAQLGSAIAGYNGQINSVRQQEQQEKAALTGTLQSLQGQLSALEAEMDMNRSATASLQTQVSLQEELVRVNFSSVSQARKHLREARGWGDEEEISQARLALNTAESTLGQNRLVLEQLRAGEVPEELYAGQRQAIQAQIDAVSAQLSQSYSGGMVQYYGAQIEAARQSIAQMEEKAGQAALTSPVGGILYRLPAGDRNALSQQEPAAYIGDAPCVEVFVPVREIDGVSVGDAVELILDRRLGNETLAGVVFDVEEEARVRLSALGVEERKVRVLIRPESEKLQIGYGVDVRFSPHTFEDALLVPKRAVFQAEGAEWVWVVREGRLELRQVQTGVEAREGYLVDEGLREGELVVSDAAGGNLAPGRRAAISEDMHWSAYANG